MHIGLRQGCESRITSLAWNLIQLMPVDPWIHYGQLVLKFYGDSEDWIKAGKAAVEQYRKLSYSGFWRATSDETYWERCLYLTLEMFQEEDWEGMMRVHVSA
jgi:hypothetical protein